MGEYRCSMGGYCHLMSESKNATFFFEIVEGIHKQKSREDFACDFNMVYLRLPDLDCVKIIIQKYNL